MPFTIEQFFEVFRQYNQAVWPAQLLLYMPAVAILIAIWKPGRDSGRVIAASLALLWLWAGTVYHLGFFRPVNPAANLFAALSITGAGMFFWHGVVRGRLRFAWRGGVPGWAGVATLAYALLVYPAITFLAGHGYWDSPTFGAPCPVTIFTLGVLMLAVRPVPHVVFVAPVLWALIGSYAAVALGVPQDYGLLAAVLVTLLGRLPASSRGTWASRSGMPTSRGPRR
jgi:hypothetical protein